MASIFKILIIFFLIHEQIKASNSNYQSVNCIKNTRISVDSDALTGALAQRVDARMLQTCQSDSAGVHAVALPSLFVRGPMAHAVQITEMEIPLHPDNPELHQLVQLVQSGLSEQIILSQIRGTTVASRPSAADLLYLKENHVPEVIISALMEATVTASPEAATNIFNGLVFRRFFRDRSGALVFTNDRFVWRDATKDAKSFDLFMNGIRQINIYTKIRETGNFCYRIQFEFTKGNNYTFDDVQKDTGGNENLMRLLEYLKHNFPNVLFEKNKN